MNLTEVKTSARVMYLVFTYLFSISDSRTCHARCISNMVSDLDDTASSDSEIVHKIRQAFDYLTRLVGELMHTMPSLSDSSAKSLCLKVMNDFITAFDACDIFDASLHHYVYSPALSVPDIDVYATDICDAMWQVSRKTVAQGSCFNELTRKNLHLAENNIKE